VDWASFFIAGWGLPFSLYVAAQIAALAMLRGRMRWFAVVTVAPMAWVVYVTADAWAAQSDIWPILMIFSAPVALAYVVAVLIAARFMGRMSITVKPGAPQ